MEYSLEHVQGEEIEAGTINDLSEWGVGENPDRSDRACVLLISKNDKSGTRSYIDVTNTSPLSATTWDFENSADGWHQATLLAFVLWDSSTSFTADVNAVYYSSTGKFYKAKVTNSNVAPDSGSGPTNWEEITDFTAIQQGYTNVDVTDYDFNVSARLDLQIADKLHDKLTDKFLTKLQPEEAVELLNAIASMEAAETKFLSDEPEQGEEIIRALEACFE